MTLKKTGKILLSALIALAFLSLIRSVTTQAGQNPALIDTEAPEFTQQNPSAWLNSGPLTRRVFSDYVTLLDFWTFDCWNCYRSFPWLRGLGKKFEGSHFQVIGIHSPEFEHEKEANRVAEKIREFKLNHPVMMDNDMAYWRAMQNRYWPAFYLVDQQGKVRHLFVGETHAGTHQASKIENAIMQLLDESPSTLEQLAE